MLASKKIKDYLSNPKKEYKVFNLGLSKNEKEIFQNFKLPKLSFIKIQNFDSKVAQTLSYSFNGNLKDMKDLNDFLSALGNNSSEDIKVLENKIKEIAKEVLLGFEEKYCWLNIRVTYKDPYFNTPRWHTDGKMFSSRPNNEGQASFVMAFQGLGTLLIKDTRKVIAKFNEIQETMKPIKYSDPGWEKESMRIRKLVNKELKNKETIQLTGNQGCVFYAWPGTNKKFKQGALHSEPKKDTFRIFMKIIPGSKEEINEQVKKYDNLYKQEKDKWKKFKF